MPPFLYDLLLPYRIDPAEVGARLVLTAALIVTVAAHAWAAALAAAVVTLLLAVRFVTFADLVGQEAWRSGEEPRPATPWSFGLGTVAGLLVAPLVTAPRETLEAVPALALGALAAYGALLLLDVRGLAGEPAPGVTERPLVGTPHPTRPGRMAGLGMLILGGCGTVAQLSQLAGG